MRSFHFVLLLFCIPLCVSQTEAQWALQDRSALMTVQTQIEADRLLRLEAVAKQGALLSLPAALQMALDSGRVIFGYTGVSAAMILPGYGLWLGTSGYSDPTVHDTITSDMIFGIASQTKTHIAALLLKLQEEGVLSLDDPLHRWLPTWRRDQYRYIDSTIAIRQLLNHTSGIAEYLTDAWGSAIQLAPDKFWVPETLLVHFMGPPYFPAGSSYHYTNTNYLLAGLIIKAATGSSVSMQLHQKFLTPLNLSSTYLAIEDILPGNRAHPWSAYYYYAIPLTDLFSYGFVAWYSSILHCGGMFSTPEDRVRWISSLLGGKVLNQSSLSQMLTYTPQSENIWFGGAYGLGLFRGNYCGNVLWGHDGITAGYESITEFFPAIGLSLATCQNSNWWDYADRIAFFSLFRTYMNYYIRDVSTGKGYYIPGTDTVWIRATVPNPSARPLTVKASLETGGIAIDSLLLYDDRLHRDSAAGDGVWGGFWKTPSSEAFYSFTVTRSDPVDSTLLSYAYFDEQQFTTAGPVVVDSIATKRTTAENVRVDLWLRNMGKDSTIRSIKATLQTADSIVKSIVLNNKTFGNLSPGQRSAAGQSYVFKVDPSVESAEIPFTLEVSSNYVAYWKPEILVHVPPQTGIIASNAEIPAEYQLEQNYPNPFNPTTTIRYALPSRSHVTLSVFNTLGQKIRTLVDDVVDAGYQSVEFDASGLASGVYLYRLQAGDFVSVRKLVVLR